MIGKFEELVLLALIRAGPDAHAAKVYGVMEDKFSEVRKFAQLYTTLDRMARKGFVTERASGAADGRPKRLFTISGEGRRALHEAISATQSLMGAEGVLVNV